VLRLGREPVAGQLCFASVAAMWLPSRVAWHVKKHWIARATLIELILRAEFFWGSLRAQWHMFTEQASMVVHSLFLGMLHAPGNESPEESMERPGGYACVFVGCHLHIYVLSRALVPGFSDLCVSLCHTQSD
jgi:hypothetical protein